MTFERARQWLGGRSSRGEYWIFILGLVLLNVFLMLAPSLEVASLISFPFWLLIAARRLHDFGQTAWWGLAPFAVGFVIGFARSLGFAIPPSTELIIHLAMTLATTVMIGSIPGNPLANRFGAPRIAGR